MYLSKLTVNTTSPDGARALAEPYRIHQLVYAAFPDEKDGGPGRVLFRVEPLRTSEPSVVLVQSEKEPGWTELMEQRSLLSANCKQVLFAVRSTQRLRFRLRANPTIRRVFGGPSPQGQPKQSGTRVGVYGEGAQRTWLDRKGEGGGFRVLDCRLADRGLQVSRRRNGSAPLRHLCVDFEGILEVTDPDCFLAALETGIGSAKAFGFGLLSVARA